MLQTDFHGWPFTANDAEVDRIAESAIVADHVGAKDGFLRCADAENGGAGFGVEGIGLEFHAIQAEMFEGMLEHEEFGVGVDGDPLECGRDPRGTDFETFVGQTDVEITGGADDAAGGDIACDEREPRAFFFRGEHRGHHVEHVFAGGDGVGVPTPDVGVQADFAEGIKVRDGHGFE